MKVLVLGAGASRAAGYPLASELMEAIEREAASAREVMLKNAWEAWDQFRQSATGHLRTLLFSPNPEVILSVPDLCEVARDAEDAQVWRLLKEASERGAENEADRINEWWKSLERDQLTTAINARARFVDCLRWYFAFKHHQDAGNKGRKRRDYLHRILSALSPRDVVITFNWDTTVERTLAEQGRWNPITGYGFEHELCVASSYDDPVPLPAGIPRASQVTVLKVHGCFGWHFARATGALYFDSSYFLDQFGFHYDRRPLQLVDPIGRRIGPPEAPVLAYPSFLKQLRGPEMQAVWSLADEALRTARIIEVWGYSLPESDAAARTLLNSLQLRLERQEAEVLVHDPSSEARTRWRAFLGEKARIADARLE